MPMPAAAPILGAVAVRERDGAGMIKPRAYLAGPDVFLENARAVGDRKKAICDDHGIEGVLPLDSDVSTAGLSPLDGGLAIGRENEALMRGCHLLIANMTPFRGPSADVGTAYEMGFIRALGRPVFAYSNTTRPYIDRIAEHFAPRGLERRRDGKLWDPDGLWIEEHDMVDNLMLETAVRDSHGELVRGDVAEPARYSDLSAFERCVEWIAKHRLPEILRRIAAEEQAHR